MRAEGGSREAGSTVRLKPRPQLSINAKREMWYRHEDRDRGRPIKLARIDRLWFTVYGVGPGG